MIISHITSNTISVSHKFCTCNLTYYLVESALKNKSIKIVNIEWLNKAFGAKTKPAEKAYLLSSSSTKADATDGAGKKRGRGKAAKDEPEDEDEDDEEEEDKKPAPKKRGRAAKPKSEEPEEDDDSAKPAPKNRGRVAVKVKSEEPDEEDDKKPAPKKRGRAAKVKDEPKDEPDEIEEEEEEPESKDFKDGQKASSKNINVPVDEMFSMAGTWKVHIDDDGTIWDANLNRELPPWTIQAFVSY